MRYLWLFYFPLLFLPNLGFSRETPFGTLEFSDFLIGPYLVLLVLAINWGDKLNIGRLTPWMGIFVAWALLSTITISIRYDIPADHTIEFGLYKIAKLVLYGVAGILTARALTREGSRRAFYWSLLAAAVVAGLSLWSTRIGPAAERLGGAAVQTQVDQATGYTATNATSVMIAMLLAYLAGRWLIGDGTRWWRLAAPAGLLVAVAGMAVSDGRGGWVAALAGGLYLMYRVGLRWRVVSMFAVLAVAVLVLYQAQPQFREQVDMTLFPTEEYGLPRAQAAGPIDDGQRIEIWLLQVDEVWNAPLLGAGIWHRGGDTGLFNAGSHNFWLQMFLETGIVGGTLVLVILVLMWRQAGRVSDAKAASRVDVPLKAALIAAFVGGLGETYFYGGTVLFTLLAVYAPIGGLRIEPRATVEWSVQTRHRRIGETIVQYGDTP